MNTTPPADKVIAFLNGQKPLEGVWFGEKHPNERGAFWWRKYLPMLATSAQVREAEPLFSPERLAEFATMATDRAEREAALRWPPGPDRERTTRELTSLYYAQLCGKPAAEPAPDNREMIREVNFTLWMNGNGGCEPPQEWQDKWHAEHPSEAEPVPVAQDFDKFSLWTHHELVTHVRQQAATIADHARREDYLGEVAADFANQARVVCERANALEASLAACRADAERLDFLARERLALTPLEGGGWDVYVHEGGDSHETLLASRSDMRSAIDDAMCQEAT